MPVPGLPDDPRFDGLLVQINRENVLAAHAALRRQAEDLAIALRDAQVAIKIGRCGGDPVSADAQVAFNGKITDVLDLHWRHQMEIEEAADRLRLTALAYGNTDDDIARAMTEQDRRG